MVNTLLLSRLRAHRRFLAFAAVGTLGFAVDAATLYLFLHWFELGLYGGRLLSFLCAATTTWYFNRIWTFRDSARSNSIAQWLRFVATNGVGGLVNFAVYCLLVALLPYREIVPLLGVAAGSIAGLAFNYTFSRLFIFNTASQQRPNLRP